MTHYDLIVIGSGPAGEKGAAQAAYFGKRGAIVEQAPEVGGTGINTGTISVEDAAGDRALLFRPPPARALRQLDSVEEDDAGIGRARSEPPAGNARTKAQ